MSTTTFDQSDRHEWYDVQWYDHCAKAWVFSWSGPSLERARGHIRFHEGSVDTWRIVRNVTEIVPNRDRNEIENPTVENIQILNRVRELEKKLDQARSIIFNDEDGDLDFIKLKWQREIDPT